MIATAETFDLRLVCAPGLEALLADEAQALLAAANPSAGKACAAAPRLDPGGVGLDVDALGLAALVAGSRLAESWRVLALRAPASGPNELDKRLRRLDWARWLPPGRPLRLDASCSRSRVYHTGLVLERARAAIDAAMGLQRYERDVDADPAHVSLRVDRDLLEVRVEAGSARGHRRGWRRQGGRAPLRETMAAAVLRVAGFGPGAGELALADPFCGSGTLLIEAATLASGAAPTRVGPLGVDGVVALAAARAALSALPAAAAPTGQPRLIGGDRDAAVIAAAQANADAAGCAGAIRWDIAEVAATVAALPPGCAIVCNLPYGVRTDPDAGRSVRAFAAALQRRDDLGAVWVLDGGLAAAHGLELAERLRFRHGGLEVRLLGRGR